MILFGNHSILVDFSFMNCTLTEGRNIKTSNITAGISIARRAISKSGATIYISWPIPPIHRRATPMFNRRPDCLRLSNPRPEKAKRTQGPMIITVPMTQKRNPNPEGSRVELSSGNEGPKKRTMPADKAHSTTPMMFIIMDQHLCIAILSAERHA